MARIHIKLGMFASATILCVSAQVFGQIPSPTAEELAEVKRKHELLRHPTFASLRLVSAPRDVPREAPTDTPAPYKVKDYIAFELFMTQNSYDTFTMWIPLGCFNCRPELTKDGEVIPYNKKVQKLIESQQPQDEFRGSGAPITYHPGRQYGPDRIDLKLWYDTLEPGRYQLTVRRRFVWDGDWVVSNPVYFEVIPPPAAMPIPPGVTIEVLPDGAPLKKNGVFELAGDVIVVISVVNDSDQPLKLNVIDRDYGNRLQLFKDGKLLPYREDVTQRINDKEESPRKVEIVNDIFLDPKSRSWSQGISLKDWYGQLAPGSYRLRNRHRFEIDGPWTAESAPLLFTISAPPQK